jgi:hypothetical protein
MKGKKIFTQNEADQILKLIEEKLKTSKSKQKGVRDKIRGIGFYYSDFSNQKIPGGYTQDDFLKFIKIEG